MNDRLHETYRDLLLSEQELRSKSDALTLSNNRLERVQNRLEESLELEKEHRRQLEESNYKLKEAQSQLVQAEKMATLGEITSGIAHEVSNPLNFISGGAQGLKLSLQDLLQTLNLYEKLTIATTPEDKRAISQQLTALKEQLDFNELLDDTNGLLDDIVRGTDQAAEVVKSLQEFSQGNDHNLGMANIHSGINAALVLLRNKIHQNTTVVKNYDSNITQIECYSGQLNQVFLAIISNALDAIQGTGKLTITSHNHKDHVAITFQDNGQGIPQHLQDRIFEPHFTTQKANKGATLELSVCQTIVNKHQGFIQVESHEGKGTTVTIILPKHVSALVALDKTTAIN